MDNTLAVNNLIRGSILAGDIAIGIVRGIVDIMGVPRDKPNTVDYIILVNHKVLVTGTLLK
jgi:hypothetical protein